MMYAMAMVAERDIPAKQCTSTRPLDAFAFSTWQKRNWQLSNSAASYQDEKFAKESSVIENYSVLPSELLIANLLEARNKTHLFSLAVCSSIE